MDKALVEEFNKRYFGKNQLKRRIYDENELEFIWENINNDRKKKSIDIDIKLNDKNNLWYNITEDVKLIIDYINDIKKSEIMKYLADKKSIDKNIKISNDNLLDIKNIEEFYIKKYGREDNGEIYIDIKTYENDIVFEENFNYNFYKLNNEKSLKQQFGDIIDFIERDKKNNVIIKSAILNFYIAYLKPFASNNLEMSEWIINSYLINNGYEIIGYCSWLDLIKDDERRYVNAIENTLINEGDLTYFIKYYVAIIQNAIKKSINGFSVKYGKKIIKELLDKNNVSLEERQLKLINSMVVLSNNKMSIDDYRKKTKVSYETARSDLNELVTLGFFKINKCGKKYEYYFNDIGTIMEDFNETNIKN